jgi:hypothetical protein
MARPNSSDGTTIMSPALMLGLCGRTSVGSVMITPHRGRAVRRGFGPPPRTRASRRARSARAPSTTRLAPRQRALSHNSGAVHASRHSLPRSRSPPHSPRRRGVPASSGPDPAGCSRRLPRVAGVALGCGAANLAGLLVGQQQLQGPQQRVERDTVRPCFAVDRVRPRLPVRTGDHRRGTVQLGAEPATKSRYPSSNGTPSLSTGRPAASTDRIKHGSITGHSGPPSPRTTGHPGPPKCP